MTAFSQIEQTRAWQKAHPDKVREYRRRSYLKNRAVELAYAQERQRADPSKQKEASRRHYEKNREEIRAKAKIRREADPQRALAYSKAWRKKHPATCAQQAACRRFLKRHATPLWLSAIQKAQIAEFYEIAVARTTQTGTQHEVDHIHPLKGRRSQGLHVPWNLQILTASENASKGNREP